MARHGAAFFDPIMRQVPLSSITIPPNRQRTEVPDEHIGELLGSIFNPLIGLLNAPVVEELPDGTFALVAGECRLRTIKLGYTLGKTFHYHGEYITSGMVPVVTRGELDELTRREIEYAENAVREDLSWQDNAKAIAALHELRSMQAAARGETQTLKQTAQEIYKTSEPVNSGKVSDSVLIAKHLDNPAVAKATNLKEAKKILVREDERKRREVLAAVVGKQSLTDRFQVYNEDCLAWMARQPAGQFDVILTDPPYGMNADEFGDAAGKIIGIEHRYQDSEAHMKELLTAAIPEFFRLAKPEAHLYLWCDIDYFGWLKEQCAAAGWWVHRTPLINVKPAGGRVPWPEHGPRRSYELCLYAVKGKRRVTNILPDVFSSGLTEGNLGHGAQKPVEAFVELLKRSTRPGDLVLDAFAGTGTILPAAHLVGCSAVAVELDPSAYGICLERLKELE